MGFRSYVRHFCGAISEPFHPSLPWGFAAGSGLSGITNIAFLHHTTDKRDTCSIAGFGVLMQSAPRRATGRTGCIGKVFLPRASARCILCTHDRSPVSTALWWRRLCVSSPHTRGMAFHLNSCVSPEPTRHISANLVWSITNPRLSLGCHLEFHSKFRWAFIYGFFRSIYDFFKVPLVFHVGVS